MQDLKEFIETTRKVLERIDPQTDIVWTSFQSINSLKSEIENDLAHLENGDLSYLRKVYIHFLPTSIFQEIYINDAWDAEYLDIAARMDELYARLRPIESKKTYWKQFVNWVRSLG